MRAPSLDGAAEMLLQVRSWQGGRTSNGDTYAASQSCMGRGEVAWLGPGHAAAAALLGLEDRCRMETRPAYRLPVTMPGNVP